MFDPTSLTSLEELQQLLNTLNDRLTFLEKVVMPSRVTKEELHSDISGAKIFTMSSIASLRNELKTIRDATATKTDFEQLKEEVSRSRSERS
jgi:hypothetical protein